MLLLQFLNFYLKNNSYRNRRGDYYPIFSEAYRRGGWINFFIKKLNIKFLVFVILFKSSVLSQEGGKSPKRQSMEKIKNILT